MKKFTLGYALALACLSLVWGCSSALKTNGVAITTVDAAMQAWAAYTQAGKGTAAQITTVSNAYVLYYNAELTASNAWVISVTQTNNSLLQTVTATAQASQTNLLNIIQQITQ
jgi:hypothetical protein